MYAFTTVDISVIPHWLGGVGVLKTSIQKLWIISTTSTMFATTLNCLCSDGAVEPCCFVVTHSLDGCHSYITCWGADIHWQIPCCWQWKVLQCASFVIVQKRANIFHSLSNQFCCMKVVCHLSSSLLGWSFCICQRDCGTVIPSHQLF